MKILFWINVALLVYAMFGYPLTLWIIDKISKKQNIKNYSKDKKVSVIISAYNEEKVIEKKLSNMLTMDYPDLEIIVANDGSSDKTQEIVEDFIEKHKDYDIKILNVTSRKGKTNAQNEAVDFSNGDIIVFSDANSMFKEDAITELISYFTDENIEYVCGRLVYINDKEYVSANAENSYWNLDLFERKVESNISSIAAGNGAIYACRKKDYRHYNLISSHDYEMPLAAGLNHKRALFNPDAIAYEKAGENAADEFKRKVRMQRRILTNIFTNLRRLNFFEYKSFAFFHFGHKTLRFLQAFFHIMIFVTNIFLLKQGFYLFCFICQIVFYLLAICGKIFKLENKIFYFPMYYSMTLLAQLKGAYNEFTGKSKPTWEKAESTR
ncbi:MAG: glycosyltransferase [Tissierellia bacterium]|nr:glycosyltransferase [Tissierellia bacterium]